MEKKHGPNWKDKLQRLIETNPDKTLLESFGKDLSANQTLELIDWATAKNTPGSRHAIETLFAGISQAVFYQVLLKCSPQQLDFLKKDSSVETIQHHLSQLSHELQNRFNQFCDAVVSKRCLLDTVDLCELGQKDIQALYTSLENTLEQSHELIYVMSAALSLSWNTNRADIIQELGRTKGLCQHCLSNDVGSPRTEETPATGLWQALENRINLVFSDIDTKGAIILMKDTDSALEALVKFSLWHLRDYSELGLIPETDDQMSMEDRENLFLLAEKNLAKRGLKTLRDLKQKHIYSKRALMEFLCP